MTLPAENAPWPVNDPHSEAMAEWSAWYAGDPDQLGTYYGARSGQSRVITRPAQHAGGVVGAVARWWWGTPTPNGEARAKLHVPLAADICGTSADLLFSESIKLGSESDTMQEFLDDLQDENLDAKLHEGAEVGAALGGTFLRTVWDSTVSPMPWTDIAHPDGSVPEFRQGRLYAVTLWSELTRLEASLVHRLFERHEPGSIEYALYEGTATNVGKRVPLETREDTRHLAELVDDTSRQATGIDRLTVAYAPNMLPNRLDRRNPQGRSDLQGVTPFLDALDEAYSSWWRDIRHAKSRLYLPAQYLQSDGPGQSAFADLDAEVHVPVEGVLATGKEGLLIHAEQFAIRVEEHARTCQEWTKTIVESAGYSTQSLTGDGGGAVTATEVRSHERRSYMTRGKKVRYWRAALRDHLMTQAEIANAHLGAGIQLDRVAVEFPDGVQESAVELAGTALALRNAEAASVRTRVQLVHPDWDKPAVDAEVEAILRESGGEPVADPMDAGV